MVHPSFGIESLDWTRECHVLFGGALELGIELAGSLREFTRSFSARIAALAQTHERLTDDYWQTMPLRDLVLNELQPFAERRPQRFTLDGPDLHLAANLAVPLSMALHELTANAARYGAFSVRKGCVTVRWDFVTVEGRRKLHLTWEERNGPPVEEPTFHGFGWMLLQRIVPAQCEAQVRLDFSRAGLLCEIDAPLITHRHVSKYDTP